MKYTEQHYVDEIKKYHGDANNQSKLTNRIDKWISFLRFDV